MVVAIGNTSSLSLLLYDLQHSIVKVKGGITSFCVLLAFPSMKDLINICDS
jgi:hypothetical protein